MSEKTVLNNQFSSSTLSSTIKLHCESVEMNFVHIAQKSDYAVDGSSQFSCYKISVLEDPWNIFAQLSSRLDDIDEYVEEEKPKEEKEPKKDIVFYGICRTVDLQDFLTSPNIQKLRAIEKNDSHLFKTMRLCLKSDLTLLQSQTYSWEKFEQDCTIPIENNFEKINSPEYQLVHIYHHGNYHLVFSHDNKALYFTPQIYFASGQVWQTPEDNQQVEAKGYVLKSNPYYQDYSNEEKYLSFLAQLNNLYEQGLFPNVEPYEVSMVNFAKAFKGQSHPTSVSIYNHDFGPHGVSSIPLSYYVQDISQYEICWDVAVKILSQTSKNDLTKDRRNYHNLNLATLANLYLFKIQKLDQALHVNFSALVHNEIEHQTDAIIDSINTYASFSKLQQELPYSSTKKNKQKL